jgi:hypothetical protein
VATEALFLRSTVPGRVPGSQALITMLAIQSSISARLAQMRVTRPQTKRGNCCFQRRGDRPSGRPNSMCSLMRLQNAPTNSPLARNRSRICPNSARTNVRKGRELFEQEKGRADEDIASQRPNWHC